MENKWQALSLDELKEQFRTIEKPYWISGGLPALSKEQRFWLKKSLECDSGTDHPWLAQL